MKRWIAITAAVLLFALTVAIWSGGIIFATTWPDGNYRATLAVQMTVPPEAGFLLSCDDFKTFGRPGVMWIWNDEIVADWGGP